MKHWDHLNQAERQERLGDQSIDRSVQTQQRHSEIVARYLAGLPLSRSDGAVARRIIRGKQ